MSVRPHEENLLECFVQVNASWSTSTGFKIEFAYAGINMQYVL